MDIIANDAIKGAMLHFATSKPVRQPQASPINRPMMMPRATGTPLFISSATQTPTKASTEPTERSRPALGVILVALVNNVFIMFNGSPNWSTAISGIMLLVAVALDLVRTRGVKGGGKA